MRSATPRRRSGRVAAMLQRSAKPAEGKTMATEVKVPTLGESITEATLGQWLKQPGDAVAQDEPIASLETDKVAVEVPSPVAGRMGEQRAKVGDTVAVGAVIATVEGGAAGAEAPAAPEPAGAALPESTPVNPEGPGENMEPKAEAGEKGAEEEGSHLTLSPAV